jgi:maltooligosyltrehalose trehalohydrolase
LNDPRIVKAEEAGGYGLDAQWSDDFHHALFSVISGEREGYYADFGSLAALAKSLRCVFVYDGNYSEYRGRNHGRQVVGLSGHRFVGFVQNHDQVGNRAQGERVSHEAGVGRAKIAAALVLTAPFVPMLFQGEEFGASAPFLYFTDYDDPELGRAISEGRKKEFVAFGWSPDQIPDPQAEQTFTSSKLNWSELSEQPHASLLQWHKDLIRLRAGAANYRMETSTPSRCGSTKQRSGWCWNAAVSASPAIWAKRQWRWKSAAAARCCWLPTTPSP